MTGIKNRIPWSLLSVHLLFVLLRTVPKLRRQPNNGKRLDLLCIEATKSKYLKEALFLIALPMAYGALRRRHPRSVLPALVSAPLLQLLDPSLQRTLAIYASTAAVVNSGRRSNSRQFLPPTWTFIMPANAWLLWVFLFKNNIFPRGYGDIILGFSGYASGEPSERIAEFCQRTEFEKLTPGTHTDLPEAQLPPHPHRDHTRAVCARFHPRDPSCIATYLRAWKTEFPKVWKWIAPIHAVSIILKRRGRFLDSPRKALLDWFLSTARGTAFVVGAINTSWGIACLLQRVLHPGSFKQTRWLINGTVTSLWVLILPAGQREEIALYTTRFALDSLWELGGSTTKYGEIPVFALAWASLLRDRINNLKAGPRGLTALLLDYIDKY